MDKIEEFTGLKKSETLALLKALGKAVTDEDYEPLAWSWATSSLTAHRPGVELLAKRGFRSVLERKALRGTNWWWIPLTSSCPR
jgi:hypothetical protein